MPSLSACFGACIHCMRLAGEWLNRGASPALGKKVDAVTIANFLSPLNIVVTCASFYKLQLHVERLFRALDMNVSCSLLCLFSICLRYRDELHISLQNRCD